MSVNSDIAKLQRAVGMTPSGIFDGELAAKLVERLRLDEPPKEHALPNVDSRQFQAKVDAHASAWGEA